MSSPIVKWVQIRVNPRVNFFRISLASKAGKKIMKKFAVPVNSAYLIFDAEGEEVWRSYAIPFRGNQALRILGELKAKT